MRYDVVYGPQIGQADIQPHFCREWEGDQGCYGTNPHHGFTWEEARQEVAKFYDQLAANWRDSPEPVQGEEQAHEF